MKVKKFFTLSLESIDDSYEFVQKLLLKYNCSKSDIVRAQLFVEETIVHWQKGAQENETFEISLSKRFKTITLSLNYRGNQSDPLTLPEDVDDAEFNLIGQNILIGLSAVTYSYENGCNNVSYTLKAKSANPALKTAIALVAGIFCGLAFQYFSPTIGLWLANTILKPLIGTFFGFINAMVVPVLFLSTIGSIFTIIFNLLNIPLEGLALAVTIAIFMNYPATAGHVMVTNIGMLHTEHMLCAKEIQAAYKEPVSL